MEKKNKPERDWSKISSVEELKKLVQEYVVKNEIKQYSDLPSKIKSRIIKLGLHSYDFNFPKSKMNLDSFVDLKSVQKFIDEQKLKRIGDPGKGSKEIRLLQREGNNNSILL